MSSHRCIIRSFFSFHLADVVFASASRISCAHSKSFSSFMEGQLHATEVLLDFRTRLSSYAFVPFLAVLCVLYYIIVRNVQCIIVACSCSIPRLCAETLIYKTGTSLGENFSKGPMLWMRGLFFFCFFLNVKRLNRLMLDTDDMTSFSLCPYFMLETVKGEE